jgi:hypothetical protein
METGMISNSLAQDSPSASIWTNDRGERYHALVVSGTHQGMPLAVGVAVLRIGGGRFSLGGLHQLATVIGTHLLRTGDVVASIPA